MEGASVGEEGAEYKMEAVGKGGGSRGVLQEGGWGCERGRGTGGEGVGGVGEG